ncbi:MAG: 50S ribosomal protein L11 methyltransferase [Bacteroidia bacterium]
MQPLLKAHNTLQGTTYIEAEFTSPQHDVYEILMAELADIGFESFTEEEDSLKAFIQQGLYVENEFNELCDRLLHKFPFSFKLREIAPQNWNAVWESNFPDIKVEDKVHVRAMFHEPDPSCPIEIVIQPKMSFGTGHHATTWSVMKLMLDVDFKGKKVFDFGTGTGILAILAQKLGADEIWAVDNDPQCIENATENFELNHTPDIKLALGDITAFQNITYDIIIGNITRNVILAFLPQIATNLNPGGVFIASGFYFNDLEMIQEAAALLSLTLKTQQTREGWCAAVFIKQ